MHKRGMSGVIVTMILIGISLAVIGIVWFVVSGVITHTQEEIENQTSSLFSWRGGLWESVTGMVTWENDSSNIYCEDCNVGIGTTSPTSILHVYSDSVTGNYMTLSRGTTDLNFALSAGEVKISTDVKPFTIGTSDAQKFNLITNNTNALTIDTSGKVGIGTTTPSTKLQVGNASGDEIRLSHNAQVGSVELATYSTGGLILLRDTPQNAVITLDARSVGANWITVNTSAFVVKRATGNVGIGTSSPTSKLHVIGKITATGGVDPPYVSYSAETHESIKEFAKDVDEHEEVMLFWNTKTHQLEIYHIEEDKFYDLFGNLLVNNI